MRVAVYTLGCKVNQFESQAVSGKFEELGHEVVPWRGGADLFVVNTCAVTARAASQSRQMVRRFRRDYPDARVIATGCHVQTGAGELMKAAGGRLCLVGNDQKRSLVELALASAGCLEMYVGDIFRVKEIAPFMIRAPFDRTRAFVRIQDGCDSFCSYCIVPYARGRSRSMPPEMVHRQIALLELEGIREVVITGIHVGFYGQDLADKSDLLALLRSLCGAFPAMRFRLSSIDPSEISDEMIEWAASCPNFCPHWHLPLQSGSEKILKAMNRKYTGAEFRGVVDRLLDAMPDAAIGMDVMTGFPGEGDDEFFATLQLLQAVPLAYLHVFPYSPRPHTVAAALDGHVARKKKIERSALLRRLGAIRKQEFYERNRGTVHQLLVERRDKKTGLWQGMTENYISTLVEAREPGEEMKNSMIRVRIKEVRDRLAVAEPV